MERNKYIEELNEVFTKAKDSENWWATLRAGELIGKSKGWFLQKNQETLSIEDYPAETLKKWLVELHEIMKENNLLPEGYEELDLSKPFLPDEKTSTLASKFSKKEM